MVITPEGVVLAFVGVVLPLWARYFLCSSDITSVYVVFMSVDVV